MQTNAVDKNPIEEVLAVVRELYPQQGSIALHEPIIGEQEKESVLACLDSSFVSSVGQNITDFENRLCDITGANYSIAMVNGTASLHIALLTAGVKPNMEVITPAATFIATANAINYCGAEPVFVDVNYETLGLCPTALEDWLHNNTRIKNGCCINQFSGKEVKACVVMHSFGHPAQLEAIKKVCENYHLILIEDAAEALGSQYGGKSVGTMGLSGIFSFNGNKIITSGGGGALITNNPIVAQRARHLATTAKLNHAWDSCHDEIGYNYRMPALNAALANAQIDRLPELLTAKHKIAKLYADHFDRVSLSDYLWVKQPQNCQSNYWLNTVLCPSKKERDQLLSYGAEQGIQCRPLWQPLSSSKPYSHCQRGPLPVTTDIAERLINLPSSVRGSIYDIS